MDYFSEKSKSIFLISFFPSNDGRYRIFNHDFKWTEDTGIANTVSVRFLLEQGSTGLKYKDNDSSCDYEDLQGLGYKYGYFYFHYLVF